MYNDDDIGMAELAHQANTEAFLRRRGICTHPGVAGKMGATQHGYAIPAGMELMCWDCGQWFRSQGEWLDTRDDILAEYL